MFGKPSLPFDSNARSIALSFFVLLAGSTLEAGVIPGIMTPTTAAAASTVSSGANTAVMTASPGATNARAVLGRAANTLAAVQAMQLAASKFAASSAGPGNLLDPANHGMDVPDGLASPDPNSTGPGLRIDVDAQGNPVLWQGAGLPTSNGSQVTIAQSQQFALLQWRTFDIGKNTTLTYNQSGGQNNAGNWIAFNKINDPSGRPSQILGTINTIGPSGTPGSGGQVYVINQNGIIFGGSSQVNTHALVASSLPINDNLVSAGLLNNPDSQFLFSALQIPALVKNATAPSFTPPAPPAGKIGDIVIQPGAQLTAPSTADHGGGLIALIGPNVTNAGKIETDNGQTILAAGLQVGFVPHAQADPTLRGLDVYVGEVSDSSINTVSATTGTATNGRASDGTMGLIEVPRGNVTITGKTVNQLGAIDSSTSVSYNGRVDLLADYNATIITPSKQGDTQPPLYFDPTASGTVTLGAGSVTQILPDLASTDRVVGTQLALPSLVNVQGSSIYLSDVNPTTGIGDPNIAAMIVAPSATTTGLSNPALSLGNPSFASLAAGVTLSAGKWNAAGNPASAFGYAFFNTNGQIYLDPGAAIDVAGSEDVSASVAENIVPVQLRGTELANSPLQRNGPLRGQTIQVDVRQTGNYNGQAWAGTPLGDASGYINLIERTAGELTTGGGTVSLSAGDSVVMQPGSTINVSGGWINYEGGIMQTTQVISAGHLMDISKATPDLVYSGIYNGTTSVTDPKWGVTETFNSSLALLSGAHYEQGYVQGGNGGSVSLTAPAMALDGGFFGNTVAGSYQRTPDSTVKNTLFVGTTIIPTMESILSVPNPGALSLIFHGENSSGLAAPPSTAPSVTFASGGNQAAADPFQLDGSDQPLLLRSDRQAAVFLSPDLVSADGLGNLTIYNSEGNISVPDNVSLAAPAGGAVAFTGANIEIDGAVSAPAGTLNFTVDDASPLPGASNEIITSTSIPVVDKNRGQFTLGPAGSLSTAGLIVDDQMTGSLRPLFTDGGKIIIAAYRTDLSKGSTIDVSGGVAMNPAGKLTYGAGGILSITGGQDPKYIQLGQVPGENDDFLGHLVFDATLTGYSGKAGSGGNLTVLAPFVQIGGSGLLNGDSMTSGQTLWLNKTDANGNLLDPDFFSQGGFSTFNLAGLGGAAKDASGSFIPYQFDPGFVIAPATTVAPQVSSWMALTAADGGLALTPALLPIVQRTPAALTFAAKGITQAELNGGSVYDVRGDLVVAPGAVIQTDPLGSVTLLGGVGTSGTVAMLGSIRAPGGTIEIDGATLTTSAFQDPARDTNLVLPTVDLGPGSTLSAAGTTINTPDTSGRGLLPGKVLPGGTITITGNIVAEAGAILDVSGASGQFDVLASYMGASAATALNGSPVATKYVRVKEDSNGGTIRLLGGEELFTDATLSGDAGGSSATGGSLVISSGRIHGPLAAPQDPTLILTQSGSTIPTAFYAAASGQTGIGHPVLGLDGKPMTGEGYFAADTFNDRGFGSLTLGTNVQYSGEVTLTASNSLAVGTGGVVLADSSFGPSSLTLTAPYVALGQAFLPPLQLGDQAAVPFKDGSGNTVLVPPSYGAGSLTVKATALIDIGNLSLQGIGTANLNAGGGDIRSDGTFDVAGNISLAAGQIYAPTATTFSIAAYDSISGSGSIKITNPNSVTRPLPLSAGSTLNIFASSIDQEGVLRVPLGRINLGWDGTGTPPWTDPLAGGNPPVTQTLTLSSGSVTSISAIDPTTGQALTIPYGINLNGSQWIDPTGTDITLTGVQFAGTEGGRIKLSALKLDDQPGSSIDIRGGGDLYAYQWVSGTGGTADILNTNASFAIIPGYQTAYAPFAPYNPKADSAIATNFLPVTNGNLTDPGYTNTDPKFHVGDQIYLQAGDGLAAGIYTLLPARYALLPGAYLVTPKSGTPAGTVAKPDGSALVSGYRFNAFDLPGSQPLYSSFELGSSSIVRQRAQYDDFAADTYIRQKALDQNLAVPPLPVDSGQLVLTALKQMTLEGTVASKSMSDAGHGGLVDIDNPGDILITGPNAAAPANPNTLVLNSKDLSSFGAESLLIGGIRTFDSAGTAVTVAVDNLKVDNSGSPLIGPEITLVANNSLTFGQDADIEQRGALSSPSQKFLLGQADATGSGNGTLLRVSSDPAAEVTRMGVDLTAATPVAMTIEQGTKITGASVTLDSTGTTLLDPKAVLNTQALALDSGQISLQLGNSGNPQGLVLTSPTLQTLQNSATSLSLLSYSSIDIYGSGQIGASTLANLALRAGEIRGFNTGGTTAFTAQNILIDNSANVIGPGSTTTPTGTLAFSAGTIRLGANQLNIDQYAKVELNASNGVLVQGSGGLATQADLAMSTPVLTGATSANQTITAGGKLEVDGVPGGSTSVTGGLGASLTLVGKNGVTDSSTILLPSGVLTLHATGGDVSVGGTLDTSGTAQTFFDSVKYTNGGQINLTSDAGNIILAAGSTINVSAQSGAGNAGSLAISTPKGVLASNGALLGQNGAGGQGGAFSLDAGNLTNEKSIDAALNAGGFIQSRSLRVRSGDVAIDGLAVAHSYNLSADQGSINVTGTIDAHGTTGGVIDLEAYGSVTLSTGSLLTVAGNYFDDAGKGGAVSLEAGSETNGVSRSTSDSRDPTTGAFLLSGTPVVDVQTGSTIDLSVKNHFSTSDLTAGNSVSSRTDLFAGTLHLRAPQTVNGADVQINPINGAIINPSGIVVEGYKVYAPAGGVIDTVEAAINTNGQIFATTNGSAMASRLTANWGTTNPALDPTLDGSLLHIRPGAEIVSTAGDLTLNTAWDLSTFRFGPNVDSTLGDGSGEPGILTLRSAGNLALSYTSYNSSTKVLTAGSLSDGFGPTPAASAGGLWQAPLMPAGSQSWAYRLIAGADFGAADFRRVQPLTSLAAGSGSLLLGKNSPVLPASPASVTRGAIIPQFYQVIRTGTGDIDIFAGRDVQLLNPLGTIYTAGTQAAVLANFDLPILSYNLTTTTFNSLGNQGPVYPAQYSMAGGNVTISAQHDIAANYLNSNGTAGSSKELPTSWLYRRGYVDPSGQFAPTNIPNTGDPEVASTTWWIDFSNFFEDIGALGGGNVSLMAGGKVSNVDAVVPTNARMPKGTPNAANLVELGGGDLAVLAGNNIDGGVYYVERGFGVLSAGNEILTNSTRAAVLATTTNPDSSTWLPTTLFLGKGSFDITAGGDLLLGPVANPFLLPQGLGNTFFDKTYFSTYAVTDAVNVSSLTGDVRLKDNPEVGVGGKGSLIDWYNQILNPINVSTYARKQQPWLDLVEATVLPNISNYFSVAAALMPGTLRATAFSGDLNLVGSLTLSPSPSGTVDFAAHGSINGVQINGFDATPGVLASVWASSVINLSDADPSHLPGIATPLAAIAATTKAVNQRATWALTPPNLLQNFPAFFEESGSFTGSHATLQSQQALHADLPINPGDPSSPLGPLHSNDPNPVHFYTQTGDISGITLFAGKKTQIVAGQDITDVAFYVQNNQPDDLSLIVADRNILAFDPNSPLRLEAKMPGNEFIGASTAGDIQIGGPGTLEVLAGRNFDLGAGASNADGTSVGLTSIGNARNPALPFGGASVIVGAGVGGSPDAQLDFTDSKGTGFVDRFLNPMTGGAEAMRYLPVLGTLLGLTADDSQQIWAAFNQLSTERQYGLALELFYLVLRDAGRDFHNPSSAGFKNYNAGFAAIAALFPGNAWQGDLSLSSRNIKTENGGDIALFAPGGGLALGFQVANANQVPPGIVTEHGGDISIFTRDSVDIGVQRIFTLRGGDEIIWSSTGNIAAGRSSKTVQTAPPTEVLIDPQSADVKTDLAGLATGGGIGVLAAVAGVPLGNVDLIAPAGVVDAGDAGIRATGNLNIAAVQVLNASNIQVGGTSAGTPPSVSAPSLGGLTSASNTAAGATNAADQAAREQARNQAQSQQQELPSIITVEVIGYGGGEG